jgi:hypothetical protein
MEISIFSNQQILSIPIFKITFNNARFLIFMKKQDELFLQLNFFY